MIQAALLHYQFEAIHPFLDGNGRVGRLLIILFLVERKILSAPFLYLSAFFEVTRSEYYDLLMAVSQKSLWNPWLEYFLNGIARMSEDAISRANRITRLLEQWHQIVTAEKPKILHDVINLLAENPFWTINKIADRLQVAFTTAQRAVNVLIGKSIVSQVDDVRRGRVYCANEIMKILDEPPLMNTSTTKHLD